LSRIGKYIRPGAVASARERAVIVLESSVRANPQCGFVAANAHTAHDAAIAWMALLVGERHAEPGR